MTWDAAVAQSALVFMPIVFKAEFEKAPRSLVFIFQTEPSYSQYTSVTLSAFCTFRDGSLATMSLSSEHKRPNTHGTFHSGLAPARSSVIQLPGIGIAAPNGVGKPSGLDSVPWTIASPSANRLP